jgi:hypothetical protein
MYVKNNDGTTDIYKLSDVNFIVFDSVQTGIEDIIPNLFKLNNYPNPFRQNTTIAFILDKEGIVELNIFDNNGNLIKNLLNEMRQPGEYSLEWDGCDFKGSNVASGLYFYQLKIDNSEIINKMILIK